MTLLTEENYPVTFGFLRRIGLELFDENQRRVLPDFVELFEAHFELSEEMHDYVVSILLLCLLSSCISSDCSNLLGIDFWSFSTFSVGFNKRVRLSRTSCEVDL